MARENSTSTRHRAITDSAVLSQWAYARVGQTLVLCTQGDRDPPDTDLDGWFVRVANRDYVRILVQSLGGAPNAKQRARLAAYWKSVGGMPPLALLSDSFVARSVLTAYSWLSAGEIRQRAFARDQIEAALAWLEETSPAALFEQTIASLHGELTRHAVKTS